MARNFNAVDVANYVIEQRVRPVLGAAIDEILLSPGFSAHFDPLEVHDIRGTHTRWITHDGISRPDPTSYTNRITIDNIMIEEGVNAAGQYQRCCTVINGIHRVLFLEDGQVCIDGDYL